MIQINDTRNTTAPTPEQQAEHRAKQPPLMDFLHTSVERELALMAKGAAVCERLEREERS